MAGIGTAAVATSGSSLTSGSATSSTPAKDHGAKDRGAKLLRHALHAQWVTKDKDGKFVTHDAIHGTVTAVSATSITVQAEDKTSQTFVVNGDTKVRVRANGKAANKGVKATITQVHSGDKAVVIGTGTTSLTANGILDTGK
ncbi:MAG: hypothetical protein DLM58_04080 [Pseudonocardiales bacterium]|nr:MAG: hypothetical protein DLM58_04080 [Pseudonocardiales bacterium]